MSHAQPTFRSSKTKRLLLLPHCHLSLLKTAEVFPNPDSSSMWRTCSDTLGNQDWILRTCVCVLREGLLAGFPLSELTWGTWGVMPKSVDEQWGLIDYRRLWLAHAQSHSHSVEINMEFLFCSLKTGVSAQWSSTGLFTWAAVLDCSNSHEGHWLNLCNPFCYKTQ